MINLFWKIFLIFWVSMIAMGSVIAWTTAQIGRERIPLMIEREKEQFAESVAEAEKVLRTRGVAGFREWLDDTGSERRMNVFLLDPSGREVLGSGLGRRVPVIAALEAAHQPAAGMCFRHLQHHLRKLREIPGFEAQAAYGVKAVGVEARAENYELGLALVGRPLDG